MYDDPSYSSMYKLEYHPLLGSEWFSENGRGMTIQEYANSHGISYEAVRRQVKRYREKLIPHIILRDRTQYFDDSAIAFLEAHRRPSAQPDDSKQLRRQLEELRSEFEESKAFFCNFEKLEALEQEIGALKNELSNLQLQLKEARERYRQKQEAYEKLLETYNRETTALNAQLTFLKSNGEIRKILSSTAAGKQPQENFDL